MNNICLAFIGLCSILMLGCGSTIQLSSEPPESLEGQYTEYYIGVGDELAINVWRNEDLSLEIPVRPDGKISLPLVGDIQAAGRTATQLTDDIRSGLINYIRNPQITVIVTDALSSNYQQRVRVTGAVETPLSVPPRQGMTVLDLVLEAGGVTEYAIPNKAVLYRRTEEGVKAYPIYLGDILKKGKLSTNYEIAPSDIITVPERTF